MLSIESVYNLQVQNFLKIGLCNLLANSWFDLPTSTYVASSLFVQLHFDFV